MNTTWYECKIKYRKTDDNGAQKMISELYLIDAETYTEAEARITHEMSAYISEEFKIMTIKTANYSEIHPFENCDRWFKSKISLLAFDEESGKERKSNFYILVQANDVKEAFDNTTEVMKTTLGEYSIPAISESAIMDVFPYFEDTEKGAERLERFNALKTSKPAFTDNELQESTADLLVAEAE